MAIFSNPLFATYSVYARNASIARLSAPAVTTTSIILSSNEIQNGDNLVPTYLVKRVVTDVMTVNT